ncbi:recombinase-like helix-turn-helix domain-containing protein [Streptomyces sp. NPDC056653]|uniref:recombinase-like helix-turn-helix domain-containing protein n=1 Tax=Streptomyces sp. NPDC056653 TaxID=3345894 RepID=UPI0036BAC441
MTTPQYLNPHQARTADPTPYEKKLAAVIEDVFGSGAHDLPAHDLPGLVAGLNARDLPAPDGNPWTEDAFRTEMRRLGA